LLLELVETHVIKAPLLAVALIAVSSAAGASPATLDASEYNVSIGTEKGRVTTCGLTFDALIRTIERGPMFISGSINRTQYPGKWPAVLVKVVANDVKGEKPVPTPITFVSMMKGKLSTAKGVQHESDHPNTRISVVPVTADIDLFTEFTDFALGGPVVSFAVKGTDFDYAFPLPALDESNPKQKEIVSKFMECDAQLMSEIETELKAMQKPE
jgi:hypothetical protein